MKEKSSNFKLKDEDQARNQLESFTEQKVCCVVVHRNSTKSTSAHLKISEVRAYAEKAVDDFIEKQPTNSCGELPKRSDFIVIEVGIDNPKYVRVSTLQ